MLVTDFSLAVRRVVQDDTITDELILDGIRAAQAAISSKVPQREAIALVVDGSSVQYILDARIRRVESIVDETTKEVLARLRFGDGLALSGGQAWWEYPRGTIRFVVPPTNDLTLYCTTDYTTPTTVNDDVGVPERLIPAALYYVAAYSMLPDAIGISSTNPFKTRIDSGNPEHNPVKDSVVFLMRLYEAEMSRIPAEAVT